MKNTSLRSSDLTRLCNSVNKASPVQLEAMHSVLKSQRLLKGANAAGVVSDEDFQWLAGAQMDLMDADHRDLSKKYDDFVARVREVETVFRTMRLNARIVVKARKGERGGVHV